MDSESEAAEASRLLPHSSVAGDANTAETVPPWREQGMALGLAASMTLGMLFCLIVHKLNLMAGIIPSLNIVVGLLGYFLMRTWTKALEKLNIVSKIQTLH